MRPLVIVPNGLSEISDGVALHIPIGALPASPISGDAIVVAGRLNIYNGASWVDHGPGAASVTWTDHVTRWDVAPVLVGSIAAGDVYSYSGSLGARFRLVPTPYDATLDAFYSTFSAGVLSGLLVTRT
jgi:hypothetical protein